jgi:hypothetical protein
MNLKSSQSIEMTQKQGNNLISSILKSEKPLQLSNSNSMKKLNELDDKKKS